MPLLQLHELESMSWIFRGRVGNTFARLLMRTLCIDKVNDLYDRNTSHKGPDFARSVLNDIGVSYEVINSQILDNLPSGPFITISNHPYGSIDGVMLVDLFGHIRSDYKVMVNRFLSRIKALDDNFICVTPVGNHKAPPSRESIAGIKDAMRQIREGHPLGIFPSGAVSDLSLSDGCVRDRQWQEQVVRLIRRLNVPVIPVAFLDRNSNFYYSLGLVDWRVRLLRLPAEVFNKRGKRTRIALGEIITPEEIAEIKTDEALTYRLRRSVYDLQHKK